jgi:predicted DNA binding protein
MTQDEIAEMLGIAKMSVNERLRYALAKAKKFF